MRYFMINRIKMIVALIIVIFLVMSCEKTEITDNPKDNLLMSLLLSDEPAEMLLWTGAGKDYCQFYERPDSNSVYCFAYITDGYDFVNVSSIFANNSPCANMDDTLTGQYMGVVTPIPSGPLYVINWTINGWMGLNYVGTQIITNKLDFLNINYLDTVSSSNNLNILYSGASNDSETISVYISPAGIENLHFFNITESPVNSEYEFYAPDNGNITIPNSIFSTFEKNRFYSICLSNSSFSSEIINNHYINKQSSYDVITTIYLIP